MNLSFIGNMGQDPVLRYSAAGSPYCFFSVAMNTHKKTDPKNKVKWWSCVAFGDVAEEIGCNFKKGQSISISESTIEITADTRNGQDRDQVKVWKVGKPEGAKSAPRSQEPPPPSSYREDEIPF